MPTRRKFLLMAALAPLIPVLGMGLTRKRTLVEIARKLPDGTWDETRRPFRVTEVYDFATGGYVIPAAEWERALPPRGTAVERHFWYGNRPIRRILRGIVF